MDSEPLDVRQVFDDEAEASQPDRGEECAFDPRAAREHLEALEALEALVKMGIRPDYLKMLYCCVAFEFYDGNESRAARELSMHRKTLQRIRGTQIPSDSHYLLKIFDPDISGGTR